MTHVGMRGVPMGWCGADDLERAFIRRFVFSSYDVPTEPERLRGEEVPEERFSIKCLDGFDLIEKVK